MASDPSAAGATSPTSPSGDGGGGLRSVTGRGVVAGIVGATVMALWFLLVDGTQGEAFRTPAFLASNLLDLESARATAGTVAFYTLVHYAAWVAVGVLVAWLLAVVPVATPVLLGVALGFALFDLVFYGSVAVTGVNIVTRLGWPAVLAGNVFAGVSLVSVVHLTGASRSATWWETAAESDVIREGIVSGLLGAAVVAAWFLVFDLVRGEPFFTPGVLGSALFLGVDSLAEARTSFAIVLGYTVLHTVAFVVAGFVAAAVVAAAEEAPPLLLGAVLMFAAFEAFFMGALAVLAEFLPGALAGWSVAVGNLLAAVAMGAYLWSKHPDLRKAVTQERVTGREEAPSRPPTL